MQQYDLFDWKIIVSVIQNFYFEAWSSVGLNICWLYGDNRYTNWHLRCQNYHSLYPLCLLGKPFLISFKQTLGQSTKYWPKTNYKSIQQHFKIFTEQKSDTYQIKWGVCPIYPSLYTLDTIREPTQADMLTFNSCSIFSHPPRVSSIHSFGGVVEEAQCLYVGLRLFYQSVVWG